LPDDRKFEIDNLILLDAINLGESISGALLLMASVACRQKADEKGRLYVQRNIWVQLEHPTGCWSGVAHSCQVKHRVVDRCKH
jgi:hypothetical protein